MTMVNGPNGGASERGGRPIVESVRCHRFPYSRRGQAIVETALLLPILMFLTMGSADLGRVFYYSIAVTNAAREAARQGTYYDPISSSNKFDSYSAVLAAAQEEVPGDVTLSLPTIAPTHCLTGQPSSWSANYPSQPNAGYVYICFDNTDTPAPASASSWIQVTILYNFQPVTPFLELINASSVHVLASTTMRVQTV
jgi:Flp pilus assembly protein TadG